MPDQDSDPAGQRLLLRPSLSGNGNAERFQKVHILSTEGLALLMIHCVRWLGDAYRLLFHFIQTNRRLKHQQHIESLLADIGDNARDVFGFGNAFVNRFTEFLDQLP